MKANEKKLFLSLDKCFLKHGVEAKMANPGFYPHYSEIGADNMHPTWYIRHELGNGQMLFTMYETISDLCLSTLMEGNKPLETHMHTGYPKTIDEAKDLAHSLFKKYQTTKEI